MGGFHSLAYGGHLFVACGVCAYSCIQTNVLAKFVDIICIFFYTQTHSLILCVIALNLNCQCSKLGYRRKLNSMLHRSSKLQNFDCVLKKGSKTHSSLCQCKPQNEAALMSRRILAGEHRCAAGLAGAPPSLQDRILLYYTTGFLACLHRKSQTLSQKSQISILRHIHIKHAQPHTK